ncbi:hypothetical protein AN958_07050 [Leucoagaricus sp. SymC.cos]|nr:hypothetical protein AN958_07050 [Leucoagaricus sp. SymC.cos]
MSISYGPMLIGVMLNCTLFGIMIMQVFIYYQAYPNDAKWMKIFVTYLATAETVNTACDMYLVYQPLIQQFAKVEAESSPLIYQNLDLHFSIYAVLAAYILIILTGVPQVLISTPVQMFMGWRIVVITQSRKIPLVIALFSIVSLAGGIWVGVQVIVFKFFSRKDSFEFNLPGVIWFVAAAVTDVIITVALVYSLHKRNTGIKKTSSVLNRIIRLTIQTGMVTTITSLLDMFLFTLSPKTAVSFVWDFSVSKLYTNALLSTLNARAGWSHLNEQAGDENVLFGSTIVNSVGSRPNRSTGPGLQGASRGTANLPSNNLNAYQLKSQPGGISINVGPQIHSSFDEHFSHKQHGAL